MLVVVALGGGRLFVGDWRGGGRARLHRLAHWAVAAPGPAGISTRGSTTTQGDKTPRAAPVTTPIRTRYPENEHPGPRRGPGPGSRHPPVVDDARAAGGARAELGVGATDLADPVAPPDDGHEVPARDPARQPPQVPD